MVAGLDLYSAYTDPALQVITAAIRSTVYLDLGVDRHLRSVVVVSTVVIGDVVLIVTVVSGVVIVIVAVLVAVAVILVLR